MDLTSSEMIALNKLSEELIQEFQDDESIHSEDAEDMLHYDHGNIEGSEDFHDKCLESTSSESPRAKTLTDSPGGETQHNRYV
jgi:hypothetical protein